MMKKFLIVLAITVAILIGGFFALNSFIYHQKQAPNSNINQNIEVIKIATISKIQNQPKFKA